MKNIERLITDLEEITRYAHIGIDYLSKQARLRKWNLEVGDFIQIEKTKDVEGIIYNKNEKGKIYIVLGILNDNLHVKGINNNNWGYLYFEYVKKYKKLKYSDLKIPK